MDVLSLSWIGPLAVVAFINAMLYLTFTSERSKTSHTWFQRKSVFFWNNETLARDCESPTTATPQSDTAVTNESDKTETEEDLKALKKLYYQLHRLEDFREVVAPARKLLLHFLRETSVSPESLPPHEDILAIKTFSRKSLEDFQRQRNTHIGAEWEKYNARRNEGGKRELFEDREEAIWWLKQISPVKLVDGAWLGNVGKVTTLFALRKTVKGAWQILSEELGDGDLRKNHVHVYHRLLESVSPGFPTPDMVEFGHAEYQLNDLGVWKAAMAQLLISLMPDEFLPEILGFNLHFEGISMDTLKAVNELREVDIDPYYFILHVSIDNSHSGHSALAIEIVCEYMRYILESKGEIAAQHAWEKMQAGYLLSVGLSGTAVSPSRRRTFPSADSVLTHNERDIIDMFKAKSQVVQGLHCCSKVKIGGRRVAEWLDSHALEDQMWQRSLLDALSSSTYWISKGNSGKSRFIRELEWNGRMFGSFSQTEYDLLRRWVDGLASISSILENSTEMNNKHEGSQENIKVLSAIPGVATEKKLSDSTFILEQPFQRFSFATIPSLNVRGKPILDKLLPLWFSHPCLLQGFVSVPFRTRSEFGCTVVRILRAQGGFEVEQECIAGLSEFQRPNSLGLIGIGMNIMIAQGYPLARMSSLKHVLEAYPSDFAVDLLHMSTRPLKLKGILIGMTTAFAKLHEMMAESSLSALSFEDKKCLYDIASRELEGLRVCWRLLENDEQAMIDCCRGYLVAIAEIEKCFVS